MNAPIRCRACGGKGKVLRWLDESRPGVVAGRQAPFDCSRCAGTGEVLSTAKAIVDVAAVRERYERGTLTREEMLSFLDSVEKLLGVRVCIACGVKFTGRRKHCDACLPYRRDRREVEK